MKVSNVNEGGRSPDFVAKEGLAVWTNQDKNGNPYLSIKIPVLGININAFQLKKDGGKE